MIADVPASTWLPILGGIATVLCCLPSVAAAWHGRDRPSWVSWSVWSSTTGLSAAASIAAGSPAAAFVPGAAFIRCALMLAAVVVGWRRYREGRDRPTRLDWTCLGLCGLSGVLWATGGPTVALCAAIATDGIASGPTWRLAWQGRESTLNWSGAWCNAVATVLVIRGFSLSDWAYPLYEMSLCTGLAIIAAGSNRELGRQPAHRASARQEAV